MTRDERTTIERMVNTIVVNATPTHNGSRNIGRDTDCEALFDYLYETFYVPFDGDEGNLRAELSQHLMEGAPSDIGAMESVDRRLVPVFVVRLVLTVLNIMPASTSPFPARARLVEVYSRLML